MKKGFTQGQEDEQCDICILNTCAVTQKAAMQSRQAIRKSARLHPNAKIIVTGCYAQSEPHKIAKINGVDCVIAQSDKHLIPDLLSQPFAPPKIILHDIRKKDHFSMIGAVPIGTRTRPFLKIQDGCDQFCTYCIVPYTRGPSLSLDPEHVISSIKALSLNGAKEVVLTGIHLGRYGRDISPQYSLFSLLKKILAETHIGRIRLSSIEHVEADDDLIGIVASSKRLCHHFHLPLQSGDDNILKRMHRPYSAAEFTDTACKINRLIPDAAIGADVLVGFPGETAAAFKNTFDLILSIPLTYLHVFPFSSRPPAPAASFQDKIRPEIIKKRCAALRKTGNEKKAAFFRKMMGKTENVLIERRRDKSSGLLIGLTTNYIPVLVDGDDSLINKQISCRITGTLDHRAVSGEIVSKKTKKSHQDGKDST